METEQKQVISKYLHQQKQLQQQQQQQQQTERINWQINAQNENITREDNNQRMI